MLIASIHLFSYHGGEFYLHHEWFLFLLAFVLFGGPKAYSHLKVTLKDDRDKR